MSGLKLTFARHGESEANVQQVYWNAPEGYGLTARGKEHAADLAERLAEGCQAPGYASLYCSPVLRARQTAQIVGRRLGLAPQVADGLREYHVGILEGRRYSEETHRLYMDVIHRWGRDGDWDARIEGGESYNDMRARFLPFLHELEDAYGVDAIAPPWAPASGAHVLLIAHGGILRSMLPLFVSNLKTEDAFTWQFGYATPIVVERRGGEWICLSWGDEILAG
jgi:probable phosphoglycerate mutase